MNNIARRKFIKIAASGMYLASENLNDFFSLFPRKIKKIPGGAWAVMVTPFNEKLQIDYPVLKELIVWYEKAGIQGFFANCASSEMYNLTSEERLELTRFVVENSTIPVVSTGTFTHNIDENADFIKKIYKTGVDGVVIITSIIVEKEATDQEFARTLMKIVNKTDDIPLGLYECPSPYKRLVSPELLNEIANTGRFVYMKDTSCDAGIVRQKIDACMGSKLKLFNAHTPDVLDTMRHHGAGTSTIASNFYPELYAFICKYANHRSYQEKIELVNNFILENEKVVGNKYRISAKYFMNLRGVPMHVNSRNYKGILEADDKNKLRKLWLDLQDLAGELGIQLA